jgi:hypothetical protein
MKNRAPVLHALLICTLALGVQLITPQPAAAARIIPEPPALTWKEITASTNLPGTVQLIDDKGIRYTLFVPRGWSPPANGDVTLTIHFHGAHWFAIQEHLARGLTGPLVNFDLGLGSDAYRRPFEDQQRFGQLLRSIEKELAKSGSAAAVRVSTIDISSFSAGYGAVRELLKVPEYFQLIRRLVLLDSIYSRFTAINDRGRKSTEPAAEHIEPWLPFAQAAIKGEKSFLITYSQVPTATYANSEETATALLRAAGVPSQPVNPNSSPASSDPNYPLLRRSDFGGFHVWGYAGKDQKAHMAHARHLADFWQALDRAR